jgi:hypothetical protein
MIRLPWIIVKDEEKVCSVDLQASHEILVVGADLVTCRQKTLRFFAKNILVRYDSVTIVDDESVNGAHPRFWERVEAGEAANRMALANMLADLKAEGFQQLDDIMQLRQGYQSKVFHTIAHLLDGFFGIDTALYNLEDDSHWLSKERQQQIEAAPHTCWLVKVAAESRGSTVPDRLHLLRSTNGKEIE